MDMWKKYAAAACVALTLYAPVAAEAHWLSSAQEKEIGTQAANDFAKKYPVSRDPMLEHIQNRIMQYNSDKLWMYGTPGKKRGLEPVMLADHENANAISYGGGQIYVYKGMFDFLAAAEPGTFNNPLPWHKTSIYQMSAMAAIIGHEIGHWENEDMLRQHDRQMDTNLIASLIPVGNVWALLGVSAGSSLINAFNSRDMGFQTEMEADEKAMEYALNVPEYSVGGQAIVEYRNYQYKILNGIEDKVDNWLHPHSKTAKRLERALRYQEELSLGFIKWNGFAPAFDGVACGANFLGSMGKSYIDPIERSFYVVGQIATAIHFDICKERYLTVAREDEVFSTGSPNNVVLLLKGHGNDFQDHLKILDTYHNVSMKDAKFFIEQPWEAVAPKSDQAGSSELADLAHVRRIIMRYERTRSKYVHKAVE